MSDASVEMAQPLVKEVRKSAGWLIVLGILTIILGVLAINAPMMSGAAVVILLGAYLVAHGVFDMVGAFRCSGWKAGVFGFLGGLLSVICGIILLARPGVGMVTLTLVLAIYFVMEGIVRIILSFKVKPTPGWGWMLFGGIVTLLLGGLVWSKWPLSGMWVPGVLVGVHILVTGWTTIFVALAARQGASALAEAANPAE